MGTNIISNELSRLISAGSVNIEKRCFRQTRHELHIICDSMHPTYFRIDDCENIFLSRSSLPKIDDPWRHRCALLSFGVCALVK